jgi:hypothetical protein
MRSIAVLAMTLLCSCGPSIQSGAGEGVALRVEPGEVSAGDSVTLVLANGTAGAVGYNLCTSGLERQVDDVWQPAASDRVCTMELRTLGPGEETRYPIEIADGVVAGVYRLVTSIEKTDRGGLSSIGSGPFQIRP